MPPTLLVLSPHVTTDQHRSRDRRRDRRMLAPCLSSAHDTTHHTADGEGGLIDESVFGKDIDITYRRTLLCMSTTYPSDLSDAAWVCVCNAICLLRSGAAKRRANPSCAVEAASTLRHISS
jgi:hypothetical protein